MGLPVEVVMPGDGAANPYTIPVTSSPPGVFGSTGAWVQQQSRSYSCVAGNAITVVGEDARLLKAHGWVGPSNSQIVGTGATSARPKAYQGQVYLDTTINALIVYGGSVTGWLNSITGASA